MRSKNTLRFLLFSLSFFIFVQNIASAQVSTWNEQRRGSLYFGVGMAGYTKYSAATIHVDQPSLGSSYDISHAAATTTGTAAFSPLLLNYRLGYFFNYNQTWGIELSYDAGKYFVADNQNVSIKGTVSNMPYNNTVAFTPANGFRYSLVGTDLFMINAVRRYGLFWGKTHKVRFDLLGKAGLGPALPKPDNMLFGNANSPKYQISGVNTGLELAVRATLFRYLFFEVAGKYDYAFLNSLKVYDGVAKENFSTLSAIGTVGFTIPTTKNHPLFEKGVKLRRIITLKPMYPGSSQ